MKKTMRNTICVLLTLVMIISSMSIIAFAQNFNCYSCDAILDNGFCTNSKCGEFESAVYTADKYDVDGDSNKDVVFEISNAGQLYWFAEQVNIGNSKLNGILLNDIIVNTGDLKNYDGTSANNWKVWTVIGTKKGFEGIFDGNGYCISGLYMNDNTAGAFGLFYTVDGEVKNLGVVNSYFNGKATVGGICVGISDDNGKITNCYSDATIIVTNGGAGGICVSSHGIIENCYNTGSVTSSDEMYVGGVVGYNLNAGRIRGCYNTGEISGYKYVAGICGYDEGSEISDCYNTGTVTGYMHIAGICGLNTAPINKCYNSGTITGYAKVAGICGENTNRIADCYNTGEINGYFAYISGICGAILPDRTVKYCHNVGKITGMIEGTSCLVGAIAGNGASANFDYCYYLEGCAADGNDTVQNGTGCTEIGKTTSDFAGSTICMSDVQFASGKICYALNHNGISNENAKDIWKQTLGVDAYPNFDSKDVFFDEVEEEYYNTGKITHQPTVLEPYVEVSDNKNATYQWYVIEKVPVEITDDNSEIISNNLGKSSYNSENGWTGVMDEMLGPHYFSYCIVPLKAGEKITVELSDDTSNYVGLFDYSTYKDVKSFVLNGVTTYDLTVSVDGNYALYIIHENGRVNVRAYSYGVKYTEIDGETNSLYAPTEEGLYACEVTYRNGEKEMSDYFKGTHIHTPADAIHECPANPTCTENGSVYEVVYCSVCNEEISRELVVIEAPGHIDNDNDGCCDNCELQLCDHTCHKEGITGFFWRIINIFNMIFGLNKTCECGVAHY